MLVLALDTSLNLCSGVIFDTRSGDVTGRCVEDIGRGHAERLMFVIERALADAGTSYDALGLIGVTVGPGSFTGIRVGVAAARGLALSLNVPAVGVSTLEALAFTASQTVFERPVMSVIDARRGEVYAQMFEAGTDWAEGPRAKPRAMTPTAAAYVAALNSMVLTGPGAAIVAGVMGEAAVDATVFDLPAADVAGVARIAAMRPAEARPSPLYLRSPDAKPQTGFALPTQA